MFIYHYIYKVCLCVKSLGYFFISDSEGQPKRPPPGSLKIFKSKNCFLGLAMVLTETRDLWKNFFLSSWFRKMLYQNYLSRQLLLKSYLIFLWTKVSHGMAIRFVSGMKKSRGKFWIFPPLISAEFPYLQDKEGRNLKNIVLNLNPTFTHPRS